MLRFNLGGKCVPFQGKFLLKKERKGVGEEKKRVRITEVTIVLCYQLDKLTEQPTVNSESLILYILATS